MLVVQQQGQKLPATNVRPLFPALLKALWQQLSLGEEKVAAGRAEGALLQGWEQADASS